MDGELMGMRVMGMRVMIMNIKLQEIKDSELLKKIEEEKQKENDLGNLKTTIIHHHPLLPLRLPTGGCGGNGGAAG